MSFESLMAHLGTLCKHEVTRGWAGYSNHLRSLDASQRTKLAPSNCWASRSSRARSQLRSYVGYVLY